MVNIHRSDRAKLCHKGWERSESLQKELRAIYFTHLANAWLTVAYKNAILYDKVLARNTFNFYFDLLSHGITKEASMVVPSMTAANGDQNATNHSAMCT